LLFTFIAVALILPVGPAAAQEVVIETPVIQPAPPAAQPRDPRARKTASGTAAISGRVTAVEGGLPVRRVQVRAMSPELRGARNATTDAEGKFAVSGLPAGRYTVTFMKAGFVQAQYGQKRPNQPGKPIDLAEGQKVDKIDVALVRGGVISGRVFDEHGEPVVDARVQVMQYRWINGRRRLANMGRMGTTNDRGEFRVWGLPPADFYVSAVSSDRPMFFDGVSAATDASDPTGYAPTYFPGTAIQDEAQRVSVASGQEINGIDFALVTTRTVRVMGTALTAEGAPMARANVMLFSRASIEGGMMSPQGASTDATGGFTIPGVAPGEYIIQARSSMGRPRDGENIEVASMPLNVGGEDLKNIVIVANRGVRVTGKIAADAPLPSGAMDGLRVFLPPSENELMMFGGPGFGQVTAQGTFEVGNVFGKRRMTLSGMPPGWTLKAVRVGGTDVIDSGYEFGKEDVTNVEFILTNKVTSLSGQVRTEGDAVSSDYVVVAFSTDETQWRQGSRYIGTARPDQNGTYRLRNLPPGSYYVVALETMPEEWGDPELFEQLKADAKRATLDEGENEALELTLARSRI
jgi:hypothetical protein